jgi:protein SCO1/2
MSISVQQNKGIKKTVIWLVLFIAVILGGVFAVHFKQDNTKFTDIELEKLGAIVFDTPRIIKFSNLIDNSGEQFTQNSLQGHWSLFYFGYTFCPDICPASLGELNQVEEYINTANSKITNKIKYIMVTVDPRRDTADKLNQYVKFYNDKFIGVTGPIKNIHNLTVQMNVPYTPVVDPEDEYYLVDHGANLAITDPNGNYVGIIKPPFDGKNVLELLEKLSLGFNKLSAK